MHALTSILAAIGSAPSKAVNHVKAIQHLQRVRVCSLSYLDGFIKAEYLRNEFVLMDLDRIAFFLKIE
jgi:hypothetical protein